MSVRIRSPRPRAVPIALIAAVLGLLGATALAQPAVARANTLTVATNGDDDNPGTLSAPLRTLQHAVDLAAPGTVIQIRGGVYAPEANVQINKDGEPGDPITMTAYRGEHVVIDGENMPYTPGELDGSIPRPDRGALHVEGDWWVFRDLEIIHGPYGIFCMNCNDNVFDRLVTRDNYESGLHLFLESGGNLIRNLDSYGNFDPRNNGESADGLAIKEGSGEGNVVRGARLWNNVDDGFDSWEFTSPILIEDSVAWGNGFDRWGFPDFQGDGNGFKLGRGADTATHTVRDSIAFGNAQHGIIDNGNPASMLIEHNTAWDNAETGFVFDRSTSTLNGNLSVGNATAVSLGSSGGSGNSWDVKDDWSDADLISTDTAAITGPRRPDGSIPATDFLRPQGHSDLGADFSDNDDDDDDGGGATEPGRYEAEGASADCDGTIDADHAGFSGSGFCNTDNRTGAFAQFTVDAPESGTATLEIRFANGGGDGRPAQVSVNGAEAGSIPFDATDGWTDWSTATVTVSLDAGGDTVRLVATGSGGLPNIDYLEVAAD
ncbi:right-handed parallel beta-helix repeat-containing protein [Glycomyces arizonensis]|uniref:right-handed parallel beta-helix repeat-containing protein n=1 Tax=Glycomyces arizonensis TaxID=256035 RepID=UPI000429432D|nr:carbohydrate-binding protein [Glycomyces arizonensis]